jgi:hypothetical protein
VLRPQTELEPFREAINGKGFLVKVTLNSRALLVGLVLVVGAAAAGMAYAAIPDSAGVIHGCYSPNGAKQKNGTPLNIIDSDLASCNRNQAEAVWNQTGPPGADGADGVSVTSASLSPGDANCPDGGSQFTAANDNMTYACNGAKGDKGDTGATGPSAAFTNYGDGFHTIGDGLTQTVASVTVPAGSYVLSGAAQAIGIDFPEFLQCFFSAGATVHGRVAVFTSDRNVPVLGDVTLANSTNPVFLRCFALDGTIQAAGQMIATQVGTVTASE